MAKLLRRSPKRHPLNRSVCLGPSLRFRREISRPSASPEAPGSARSRIAAASGKWWAVTRFATPEADSGLKPKFSLRVSGIRTSIGHFRHGDDCPRHTISVNNL